MNDININFIYVKNQSQLKKFLKENIYIKYDIINYIDIVHKLIKNDINNIQPNNNVIKFFILKKIKKILYDKNTTTLFYVLSELDDIIINSVLNYLNKTFDTTNYLYNLYIYNKKLLDSNTNISINVFDNIIEL